jgi:hypothetical protein
LKQAKSIGTDFAIQGIKKLENAAINEHISKPSFGNGHSFDRYFDL